MHGAQFISVELCRLLRAADMSVFLTHYGCISHVNCVTNKFGSI